MPRIEIPQKPPGLSAGPYSPRSPSPLNPNSRYIELGDLKHDSKETEFQDESTPISRKNTNGEDVQAIVDSWWLLELFAWFVSAAALGVLAVTIALADGQPLPHWPLQITLNSFISVLSTIMKAAVVVPVAEGISQLKWLWFNKAGVLKDIQTFDEASRGLWGSVKLMLGTRGVHLAKLGAFLTIVTLGIDPFIQQVVTYPTRQVASELYNSSIPIAQAYNDYEMGYTMALKEPSLPMKAAIYAGLYDINPDLTVDFEISPYCPTGNCTWGQRYESLAVCTKCANVTSSLTKSCLTEADTTAPYCNYTLPNGFTLSGLLRGMIYMNATGQVDTINYNGTQTTIASLTTIRGLRDLSSTNLLGAVANECVLYFCANTYHGIVESGNFSEWVVGSYYNSTEAQTDENITIVTPSDTSHFVEYSAWAAVQNYFWTLFEGNVTGSSGELSPSNDIVGAIYKLGDDESGTGAQKIGGDNTTMQAIAKSITKLLRTSASSAASDLGATEAVGTTLTTQTYVHVSWVWISLPVVVEVLALVFLLGTIIQSRVRGAAIWKSSTLALLQIRLVDEKASSKSQIRGRLRGDVPSSGSGKLHELNRWATQSKVRLHRSETGLNEFRLHRKD